MLFTGLQIDWVYMWTNMLARVMPLCAEHTHLLITDFASFPNTSQHLSLQAVPASIPAGALRHQQQPLSL